MTAQNNDDQNKSNVAPIPVPSVSHSGKEFESAPLKTEIAVKEVSKEIELTSEVKAAGVEKIQGTIDLPPDLKKLGITPNASQIPITQTPVITLPLTDDKIMSGLNSPLSQSLKWLALWCIFRLQKAHLVLKKLHGTIVRVKSS